MSHTVQGWRLHCACGFVAEADNQEDAIAAFNRHALEHEESNEARFCGGQAKACRVCGVEASFVVGPLYFCTPHFADYRDEVRAIALAEEEEAEG